jgi:hypothetical protein
VLISINRPKKLKEPKQIVVKDSHAKINEVLDIKFLVESFVSASLDIRHLNRS